ncbi:MAG: gliding motility protein GldC [Flavobacteriales bacterium]|nr:gliding motility protein GldC [Flavobacteriales bacterium]|tara:strand:+ start:416 stop:781 length:366 start_codon:yes stop_codon:yes gene_type:complete
MSNKSNLNIVFDLDENQIPEKISWESINGSEKVTHEAKAAFLSFWDKSDNNAMSLNLWTKDISIEEMSKFYFQTFITMADNFEKSTSEDQLALAIRDFADFFGEKMGIIPKSGKFDKDGKG